MNKDGIVQETALELDTSISPSLLFIDDSETGDGDDESVQVVGATGTFASRVVSQGNNSPLLDLSTMMVKDLSGTSNPITEGEPNFTGTAQTTSPRFTSFLTGKDTPMNPENLHPPPTNEHAEAEEEMDTTHDSRPADILTNESSATTRQSIVVTRQEILALTNVLGRIPQSAFAENPEGNTDGIQISVIENPPHSPVRRLQNVPSTSNAPLLVDETGLYSSCEDVPATKGKRQRPRYVLKSSMMRKHPVLKFFATGPLDRHKNPYKWWCRVCRVELSLMSRGVLELLSHYRTESHLIKEHRIRLEIPGMPLFDRYENELAGLPLQEAKRIAKETHPITPHLDICRLLVGQDKLPDLSSSTSPSADVLAQISILEQGLRYGGHVDSLIGIWNELVQLSPACEESSPYIWSKHRIFVSIFLPRQGILIKFSIIPSCNVYFFYRQY